MGVIVVSTNLDIPYFISFLNFMACGDQGVGNCFGQCFSAIFDRTHYMIEQEGYVVRLFGMLTFHALYTNTAKEIFRE